MIKKKVALLTAVLCAHFISREVDTVSADKLSS